VVTFAEGAPLATFEGSLARPGLRVLGDPQRLLYAAFGFGRASVARVWLDPRSVANDLRLRLRGARSGGLPQGDTLQLGGDVALDPAGEVRWIYASRGPEDRPSPAMVAAVWAAGLG
jgi:hypothetical protein